MSQEDQRREETSEPEAGAPEGTAQDREETGEPSDDPRPREDLAAALSEAEAKRDEYLEALQRTQAEFQNYRKRAMREGATRREAGAAEVLGKLLDVVDDFELAIVAAEAAADPERVRKGVEMVYGKLIDALRSFGLERIGQEGVPFDPELHDAVQQVEAEGEQEEPIVVEVLRPGYAVGERVIRAAMVKVAR
ncbi:MAG: nucleotide exchange factor GrpE [Nitriliruptorales bacterium]